MGKKVVRALKRKDDGISHACVDFLCALMQPMHDNFDLRQEQLNKSSLLSSRPFLELLLEPFKAHVVSTTDTTIREITGERFPGPSTPVPPWRKSPRFPAIPPQNIPWVPQCPPGGRVPGSLLSHHRIFPGFPVPSWGPGEESCSEES